VRLAREARQWVEAERLQRVCVNWDRQRAAVAVAALPDALDSDQRNTIRTLAASLHELGQIQRELGQPECVAWYKESLTLSERIGEQAVATTCALNLGNAYLGIPVLRDLVQAERWYRRSLELHDKRDRKRQAQCLGQLGMVAYERFNEARAAKQPEEELLQLFNAALQFCKQALNMLPPNAVGDLTVTHNALGVIYSSVGDLDRAMLHYRESIRYEETADNLYGAAETRFNVAYTLAEAGRFADALEYARAALRNFETYSDSAAEMIQKTRKLIAQIEQARQA
jgi:tetratricopeptide (TPR) repeat protein